MRKTFLFSVILTTFFLFACTDQETEKRVQLAEERAATAEKRAAIAEEKILKLEKQITDMKEANRKKIWESRYEKSDDIGW